MLMDGAYDTPTTAEGVILDDGDGRIGGDGAYRKSKGLRPHEGSESFAFSGTIRPILKDPTTVIAKSS